MRNSLTAIAVGLALVASSASCDDAPGTSPPPVPRTAVPLTTVDFSKIDKNTWKDGLYQIPGKGEIQGIGAVLQGCGEENAEDLELLLDRQFQFFSASFSQTRGIEQKTSTVQQVVVEVRSNYAPPPQTFSAVYDEIGKIPTAGKIPVTTYSVLSLRIYLNPNNAEDSRKCDENSSVQVALIGAVLDET